MKKVLSLALVLCMAIACFAFAPTSAEIYRENLLVPAEEVAGIYDNPPWGGYATEANICVWQYRSPFAYAENEVSTFLTFCPDVYIDGENRFGDAGSLKLDLTKITEKSTSDTGTTEEAVMTGNGSINIDFYTNKYEVGETYTMFFYVKSDVELPEGKVNMYVCGGENGFGEVDSPKGDKTVGATVTFVPTTEWQLVKFPFSVAETEGDAEPQRIAIRVGLRNILEENERTGAIYMDGIGLVEGAADEIDLDAFYANYKIPLDDDDDRLNNNEDPDLDGDGILNKYDPDMDNDGTKNVWDYDIDNDKIFNGDDDKPFGGQ